MIPTRFSVIPDERKLILGIDGADIFKTGIVYEAREILGEIIITELGEYALPNAGCPSKNSKITDIAKSGLHLITKNEYEQSKNNV